MLARNNIVKGLRDPALLFVWLRRFFLIGGLRDPECMHLVRAWSSGKLPRVGLREIFPGIEACTEQILRLVSSAHFVSG